MIAWLRRWRPARARARHACCLHEPYGMMMRGLTTMLLCTAVCKIIANIVCWFPNGSKRLAIRNARRAHMCVCNVMNDDWVGWAWFPFPYCSYICVYCMSSNRTSNYVYNYNVIIWMWMCHHCDPKWQWTFPNANTHALKWSSSSAGNRGVEELCLARARAAGSTEKPKVAYTAASYTWLYAIQCGLFVDAPHVRNVEATPSPYYIQHSAAHSTQTHIKGYGFRSWRGLVSVVFRVAGTSTHSMMALWFDRGFAF